MTEKQYVVINATREKLTDDIRTSWGKREFSYRQGQLGLIHPDVLNFHTSLEEATFMTSIPHQSCRSELGMFIGNFYIKQEGDIPIVVYDIQRNPLLKNSENGTPNYLYLPLRKGEFIGLSSKDLGDILQEMDKLCQEHDIPQEESKVINWWRHLECFETLMNDQLHEVPFEAVSRDIRQEQIDNVRKYGAEMDRIDRNLARSADDAKNRVVWG